MVRVLEPHRKRYWIPPPPDDPAELAAQIRAVCEVYEATPALAAAGAHVASTDELTGIQALERLHASLPLQPGHPPLQEIGSGQPVPVSLVAQPELATRP